MICCVIERYPDIRQFSFLKYPQVSRHSNQYCWSLQVSTLARLIPGVLTEAETSHDYGYARLMQTSTVHWMGRGTPNLGHRVMPVMPYVIYAR